MRILIVLLLAAVAASQAGATESGKTQATAMTKSPALPDSRQMESDLQHLSWSQFAGVVKAVPKLKADIDAYGKLGWKYVEMRYASYPWHKNIDKLDAVQRQQLVELIRRAQR
jgi:hypothetical protein